jgi:hypothetical protein
VFPAAAVFSVCQDTLELFNLGNNTSSIWRILLAIDAEPSIPVQDARDLLEGVVYGIEQIANHCGSGKQFF